MFQRLALSQNLSHSLNPNAETVFQYVFTELLNNAIDHSESRKVRVSAVLDARTVKAGQGFADEVFRVFTVNYPDTVVQAVNTSPAVGAMILHAKGH